MLMNAPRKALQASAVIALLALSAACTKGGVAGSDAKLETDQQKASYAIGRQIGGNMREQGVTVDVNAVAAGISEALADKESRLKPEEIQAAMAKFQEEMMKKRAEEMEKNRKAGVEYLEKNKAKAGVKTTASGLQYEVIQEGKGPKPKASDTVKVHYTGTLIDGKKFDSSVDRGEPVQFEVGGVIPGWTEALQLMPVGSKWKLSIPSALAYGPQGRPGIPPDSVLLFDVELLEIGKAAAANPAAAQGHDGHAHGNEKPAKAKK